MPYNAPVPRELAKEIRHSAAVARVRVMHLRYGFSSNAHKRDRRQIELVWRVRENLTDAQNANLTRKKLLKLMDDADRATLAQINYEHSRDNVFCSLRMMNDKLRNNPRLGPISFKTMPILRRAILAALKHEDLKFFVSLGRALSQKPDQIEQGRTTDLEEFLVEHWWDATDEVPPLFNLSIEELNDECNRHSPAGDLTKHVTEKTRQRLGLISFRKGICSPGN